MLSRSPPEPEEELARPKKKHVTEAPSASASEVASAAPSASTTATAAKKATTSTKSNEKGFGKIKSLFK
jgi:hypothetical protein